MKKYYYKVTDENGRVIFDHSSDYAERLLKMADKASKDDGGAVFASWYFGRVETNILERVLYGI